MSRPAAQFSISLLALSVLLVLSICAIRPVFAQTTPNYGLARDGVTIDCGSFGRFTLSYPQLDTGSGDSIKPIDAVVADDKATIKYPGDSTVVMSVDSNGRISYRFANPPTGLKTYRMSMLIDFSFNQGGKWQVEGDDPVAFPLEKPAQPHLYQGNADSFTLTNFEGKSLAFRVPDYSYEEINDNRAWNWNIFNWMFVAPFDPNNPRGSVSVREDVSGAKAVILSDRFGQNASAEFPGKVASASDLTGDIARDAAYYAGFRPPERDLYGGLPNSGALLGLAKTGYFHVQKIGGKWFLVDPAGDAYFHLGICAFTGGDDFTYTKGREQVFAWLPSYDSEYRSAFSSDAYWSRDVFSFYVANQIRKYGHYDPEEFQARMIYRVRQMGFNGVGDFSGISQADRKANFPWVDGLPLNADALGGAIDGLRGIFDPFKPEVASRMDEAFAKSVAPHANEPRLIGYFLENEQAFEDIPRVIPSLTHDEPAKLELVSELQAKYTTIARFNEAWNVNAPSFAALRETPLPVTSKAAASDMDAYTGRFVEAYYRLIRTTFDKYDHHHMLIGNRWQPITADSEQLCRIAGKFCDVLSLNYYTYGIDKQFVKRLYEWSGEKPFLFSEFFWSSPSDTGLQGGNAVNSQRERGLAYENYIDQAASTGFVVGVEWFTLIDQARTGRWFERYDGEEANTGLFSVTDRPYKDFLAVASKANYGIYDVLLGKRPPFAWDDPRFKAKGVGRKTATIPHAVGPMNLSGSRAEWPGNPPEMVTSTRLVLGADAAGFAGAFRMCWDSRNLYLRIQVDDPTPMRNSQEGGGIWDGDAVELFVGPSDLNRDGPLLITDRQILLSAGKPADGNRSYIMHGVKQIPCRVKVTPTVNGKGYMMEAAIPFEAVGFVPQPGQTVRFDLAIDDGDGKRRTRQLAWNGGPRDSGDRTDWGSAVFMK